MNRIVRTNNYDVTVNKVMENSVFKEDREEKTDERSKFLLTKLFSSVLEDSPLYLNWGAISKCSHS